jgi:enamine deaminase RidA (YjgF/YER057c/UK114 family)
MPKDRINPDTLFSSLEYGFSQIVVASGTRTVYISGQTAWDSNKQIVGGSSLGDQARKSFRNLQIAIEGAGGTLADIVALRIYIVDYDPSQAEHIKSALTSFFPPDNRPASTWIGVKSLASPDFLIEIEATAVLES